MTHLADGLKSAAPSLIGVSSEEFVELKPSITTLLDFFHIKSGAGVPAAWSQGESHRQYKGGKLPRHHSGADQQGAQALHEAPDR